MVIFVKDRAAVSKLDAFCLAHRIETPELARISKVSRQQAARVRYGRADVRLAFAKKLAFGASVILGRKVSIAELFALDFDWPAAASAAPRPAQAERGK
jgi:hypothetical protein